MKTKKIQSNTAPTRTKPCQYSLSTRLKVIEEKKMKIIKNSKMST